MENYKLLIGICLIGIIASCNKNEASFASEIDLQNEPPLSFDLLEAPNNTTEVNLPPILSLD